MSLTTIFVGERTLGVVSGRPSPKGVELTHSSSVALPDDFADRDATGRADALRTALAGTDSKNCILVVPRSMAILRSFSLPPGSPEEMQRMIAFQLEKDLPLPLDQVRYSYVTVPGADGKTRVSAVAVPIADLDKLLGPLEKAGCRPIGAVVSSFGLPHLLPVAEGGTLVINIADKVAEIAIIDGGSVLLSRSTPLGDSDSLATEIDRLILTHTAGSRDVRRIYVAGDDDAAAKMAADLAPLLSKSVERIVPNGTVTKKGDVRITVDSAAAAGVCVGLLRSRAGMPDVMRPPMIRRSYKLTKNVRIGILIGLVAASLIAASQISLADKRAQLATLKSEYDKAKPQAEKLEKMRGSMATINQWMDKRYPWIDLMNLLHAKRDPAKIFFSSIEANDTGFLKINGKATDDKAVTQYVSELQKLSAIFRQVDSDSITTNSETGSFKRDFSLHLKLAGLAPPPKK